MQEWILEFWRPRQTLRKVPIFHYCDLKTKLFYSYLQYYGTTQTMWRIRSNFQILLYYTVVAFSKILLHHIHLFYKLRYLFGALKMTWPMAPNLGYCPQNWVFNALLGFWIFLLNIFFFRILLHAGDLGQGRTYCSSYFQPHFLYIA